ncbi:MAG: hypothetical protein OEM77_04825 [Nitrosopumilus sp.]|nr:hypothetical protein [Nitrosopumilus sp.]
MTSAYKDPVENHHMKKFLDKIITGFFVLTFGILWYCSVKYYVKPNHYTIIVYDVFGKAVKIDGIRTNFKTPAVAQSYISEYQKRFSHYYFSMVAEMPEIKRNMVLRIFKTNHR